MSATLLVAVGLLNLIPGVVVFDVARVGALYGLAAPDPTLAVLLRHRAVLLALVGAALLAAAVWPALRGAAMVGALCSKVAFLLLWATTDGVAEPLRQVALADAVAVPLLLLAWWQSAGG